jgi:hypothetical protein
MSLPHDLSGSISKNRFRIELLWGIGKMLDSYEIGDFTMVFDYACDIELHIANGFEFYQIKTHSGKNAYTCRSLSKIDGEGSILGKLYVLNKNYGNKKIKLAIVSNSPLSIKSKVQTKLDYCFDSLPDIEKAKLEKALQNELKIDKVDLRNVFYIQTNINLRNPKNEIMGKLVISFEKIKHCEPANPNALYRLIYDTVAEKACYEYSDEEYESIIAHKGLTKAEFDEMLDAHAKNAKTGIQKTEEYIDSLKSISLKKMYKTALPKLMKDMYSSIPLKKLEKKIGTFLISHKNEFDDTDTGIELLTESFHSQFLPEYDNAEKTIFYVIIINRFIEGVYDE